MKKKIPIWIQDFRELIIGGYFYVDKTKIINSIINSIIKSNKYYFLSRPRRFWKSLTLSTMKYLFMWKKELFKNTWIYPRWDFETTNPVLYISFAGYTVDKNIKEYIRRYLIVYIDDKEYTLSDYDNKYELDYILKKVYEQTWKQIAIIVDEYDKAVLVNLTNVEVAEEMRRFFTSFYSWIKDSEQYIKLFMLTGLTKILKMNVFSVLNNLEDISYSPITYDLIWYTQKEIETNFFEEINEIMINEWTSNDEVINRIKINYNWYNFWKKDDTIYNPRNINNLFLKKIFSFYWADTWIPSAILYYVDRHSINIKELVEWVNNSELIVDEVSFKLEDLNNINIPVLFTNAWYLTVSEYQNNEYTLWYPNKETERVMTNFFLV